MSGGKVIWLTGMSGAGKTTITCGSNLDLGGMGFSMHQIDGDDVRKSYGRKLGFSRAEFFVTIRPLFTWLMLRGRYLTWS